MSEVNYSYVPISPRMPKSVSDEQLFVFVPVGSSAVAGIFKINSNDFEIENSILSIKQNDTVVKDGAGFVRGKAVYSFVISEDKKLQLQIDNLNKTKQNINLSAAISNATTVEGALTNISSRASTAESNIDALQTTVGNDKSGLVKQANDNTTAIKNNTETTVKNADHIENLEIGLKNTNNSVSANKANIETLTSDKQNKAIAIDGLDAKTVEEALKELNGEKADETTTANSLKDLNEKVSANTGQIETNRRQIWDNSQAITQLQNTAYGGETPYGSYPPQATLPSGEDLTDWVRKRKIAAHYTDTDPKPGDVVLFTQIITGGTDVSYKFMYVAVADVSTGEPGWINYVIPTVEDASNTDKGIVQGTYGDTTGNIQVSIVAGKVVDILAKSGDIYKSIKTLFDDLATSISFTNTTVAANKKSADQGIAEAKAAAAAVITKLHNVEFKFVASDDMTILNFPCKYTAEIEGVTISNVVDVYFSALQIPLEIFSSYVQVDTGKVSIFATTKSDYSESVTVPTVRIS